MSDVRLPLGIPADETQSAELYAAERERLLLLQNRLLDLEERRKQLRRNIKVAQDYVDYLRRKHETTYGAKGSAVGDGKSGNSCSPPETVAPTVSAGIGKKTPRAK
jgi:hypothetical protein